VAGVNLYLVRVMRFSMKTYFKWCGGDQHQFSAVCDNEKRQRKIQKKRKILKNSKTAKKSEEFYAIFS
jgi:hypothetical protein